ncbi:MAG TPA: response regulator transcription factor, partial [Acidimicrobiales bacterium]|nr:response regulator transcription factor [Acidimicrobiales bacterium]
MSEPERIRVLIVDDHALFRRGLMLVLESEDGIEVVGEADDGEDAIAKAEQLAPDVVLMDVRMPRISGIEATRRLAEALPTTKIIMLTVSDEEEDLYEAIKAGATGYLLKEISIEEVADAVRAVTQGQTLISPSMASKLIAEFTNLAKRATDRQQVPVPRLTDRELDVLRLVAQGITNREIAE